MNHTHKKQKQNTSWEPVEKWYRSIVGDEGHYYHQKIILPGILRLLELKSDSNLLDLGCGDGILSRQISPKMKYTGIDASPSLVKAAKKQDSSPAHHFEIGDVTKPLPTKDKDFTHASLILALQNMEHPLNVFKNTHKHLVPGGKLAIILNHPCYRIPRQSSWQIDEQKKIQYRRVDRYFTPMQIPIQANPSKGESSAATISFHYPLSSYISWLREAGFVTLDIEEWCSDKVSTGKAAKMENRSREEFPLFLAILAEAQVAR